MTSVIRAIQMPPDEFREHCLLTRRLEWIEMKNCSWYRNNPERLDDLNSRYSDVCSDVKNFSEKLASIQ